MPRRVVLAGGVLLAACAGWVNAAALALGMLALTHLTGSLSRLSADLGRGDAHDASIVLPVVVAFILGAAISGMIVGRPSLRIGRHYGRALLLEAALLAVATLLLLRGQALGLMLAACAAGLQNGLAATTAGTIVRTTHVTGIATDLGFMLGRWIRERHVEPWPFLLLSSLLVAFFAGGTLGVLAADRLGAHALWFPAAVVALAGLAAGRLHADPHARDAHPPGR